MQPLGHILPRMSHLTEHAKEVWVALLAVIATNRSLASVAGAVFLVCVLHARLESL